MTSTFVLVSGAWHASWCWERVIPLLMAKGHRCVAPDLLGTGAGERDRIADVTLADWADQITSVIVAVDAPVVLVGHSRGGIVVSEVAERIPALVQWAVYLAAFLVPNGATLMSTSSQMPGKSVPEVLVSNADGTTEIRPSAFANVFYNDTDSHWKERAWSKVGPEPMRIFGTPLHLSEQRFGAVPRAYIECERDNAVPLLLQRAMQTTLPCERVFTLASDHSPFYSAPEKLAACLNDLVTSPR